MKNVKIHKVDEGKCKYELLMPEQLAEWDVWDYWERERIQNMELNIKNGDLIIYVGAESGWMPAVVSKYISSEIVLIEPSINFWNCIDSIWSANELQRPRRRICAFASNRDYLFDKAFDIKVKDELIIKSAYESLSNKKKGIPEVKIDSLKLKPRAISIDVEGAELKVLQGAIETLGQDNVIIYLSIHPDLALRDYGVDSKLVHDFMNELGYSGKLLAIDHEEHWVFYKKAINFYVKKMRVNLNNLEVVEYNDNLPELLDKVSGMITGNSEHFYLNVDGKEVKYLRTENTDEEILQKTAEFIKANTVEVVEKKPAKKKRTTIKKK